MNLSEKIRYLRIQKGMTQAELAAKLNTTKQTIGKYENQVVTNLPLNRIQELADALETTPAYLMGWGEDNNAGSENKTSPITVNSDEAALDAELLKRLLDLTPDEVEKVDAFVQGLLAAR